MIWWYILGGATFVVLLILAYLEQRPNEPPEDPRRGSVRRGVHKQAPTRPATQAVVKRQPQRQAPVHASAATRHRKIEYAAGAALHFINALHAEGVDRGAIYSLGNTFRVDQGFTTSREELDRALINLGQSKPNENTALYDSIALAIDQFQRFGRPNVPWVLIVLTDGKDNASQVFSHRDERSPAAVGLLTAECFANASSNYFVLVGVGDANSLDVKAITTIGEYARSPAIPLASFHLLEELFLQLVIQVSETLVGRTFQVGEHEILELARVRQVNKIGIDYALVIDRSGSMDERC
jgi:Mg-chelatase subunit ChlD